MLIKNISKEEFFEGELYVFASERCSVLSEESPEHSQLLWY
jgi:hypothetical protein